MNPFNSLQQFNQLFGGAESLQKLLDVHAAQAGENTEFTRVSSASPHSDKLDSPDTGIALGDYAGQSPDHVASSSDRDASPTSMGSASDSNEDDQKRMKRDEDEGMVKEEVDEDEKDAMNDDQRLQQQILRLAGLDSLSASLKQEFKPEPAATLAAIMKQDSTPTPAFPALSSSLTSALSQQLSSRPSHLPQSFQQHLAQLMQQNGGNPLQAFGGLANGASLPFSSPPSGMPPSSPMMSSVSTPQPTASVPTNPDGTPTPQKRKRQRRNPVWPYFDVIDGTARCKQCLYSTKSVFSTNLKVHLRSHHRADYEKVIEAEDALNLNALLLSGNANGLVGRGAKRSLPPMTSSILHTINKFANQAANGDESSPFHSVLRQALAAGTLQQVQQAAKNLPFNMQNATAQLQANLNLGRQFADSLAANQPQSPVKQQLFMPNGHRNMVPSQPQTPVMQPPTPQQVHSAVSTPSLPATPTPASTPAPSSAPLVAEQFFKQFNINFPTGLNPMAQSVEMPQPKRRRLRRHPVWMFFRDLEDRMVGCINCNFSTGSAFSTNLKMHLKAHHKEDYNKVLKLEEEMRFEEGILAPNKIKSELIDFIRGGGNASQIMPGSHPSTGSPTAPRPSPLVQKFISQTLAGTLERPSGLGGAQMGGVSMGTPTSQRSTPGGVTADIVTGSALDEDTLAKLSMGDRLAALVGLAQNNGDDVNSGPEPSNDGTSELLSRLGLLTGHSGKTNDLQVNTYDDVNGDGRTVCSLADVGHLHNQDTKTSSSASSEDPEDGRRLHRERLDVDRALARLAQNYTHFVESAEFKEFVQAVAPDYEMPEMGHLMELMTEEHEGRPLQNGDGQIEIHMPALLQ